MEEFITTSEAGRRFDPPLSADRVRQMADNGMLPMVRTRSGIRLFRQLDVDRIAAERRRARGRGQARRLAAQIHRRGGEPDDAA
jgi:hypothetical protein